MAFNNTVVARVAASIWGLKLGYATTQAALDQANASAGGLTSVINAAFNDSFGGASNADITSMFISNLGLTGSAATEGTAYVLAQLAAVPSSERGATLSSIASLFSGLSADPTFGAAASAFNAKVAAAVVYSSTVGTVDAVLGNLPSATSFNLTLGQDNITGTAGSDMFNAYIVGGSNTWQSGDWTDGGAGTDTLYADMGSSQGFAVTPETTNIENIVIRGQSRASDSGDNNVAGQGRVLVDAQRIGGELRYESNNSRADVMVEDVRILSSQITKDITVAFVESDPGNVDFGVYFDQHSLTANRTTSSQLVLEVLDTRSTAQGLDPLLESPYDGVSFSLNGVLVQLRDTATSTAIQDARTFPVLLAAIQAAIARTPEAAGVTASLGPTFTVLDSLGTPVSGTQIILSATGKTFATGNWIASAGVPANSSLHTAQIAGTSVTDDLVTSTVVLDDVGRGSNGGDLLIGGLSIGTTSQSRGVDRFEITVERTSKLATINSTNNWLKEVTFKNGTTAGDVQVYGNNHAQGGASNFNNHSEQVPGAPNQHNNWGFSDVRLIDASAMTGRVMFDAEVTNASFAKYILLSDTQPDPAGDNVSVPSKTTQRADFIYSGGSNNDTINVYIDGGITASNSNIQPGREDFSFVINGNGGNDAITLRVADQFNDGLDGAAADLWYMHHKTLRNATIDAGDGNDTVRTPGAGDVIVRLGAGADTYYADNTGAQGIGGPTPVITNTNSTGPSSGQRAIWVFGTADQATAGGAVVQRELNNIASDLVNNTYGTNGAIAGFESLYRATITVTYKGLTAAVQLPVGVYRPSDLHVNQAIKSAINLDPVLSKLLVAEDGPLYSLVVKSLIDGDQVETDLGVVLTAYTVTTGLTLADERNAYSALNGSDTTPTDTELQALLDDGKVQFDTKGDFVARFANYNTVPVVGADSFTPSDNTVTGAAGNDVLVFGTTAGGAGTNENSTDTAVYATGFENDTIVWFQAGLRASGGDILNLTALGGTVGLSVPKLDNSAAAPAPNSILFSAANTNGMVYVHDQTAGTDTATEIAALYQDSGAVTGSTLTSVYVAVDTTTNKGYVYAVTDPVGAGNVGAVLAGTIDLADTLWSTLTIDNFT